MFWFIFIHSVQLKILHSRSISIWFNFCYACSPRFGFSLVFRAKQFSMERCRPRMVTSSHDVTGAATVSFSAPSRRGIPLRRIRDTRGPGCPNRARLHVEHGNPAPENNTIPEFHFDWSYPGEEHAGETLTMTVGKAAKDTNDGGMRGAYKDNWRTLGEATSRISPRMWP